MHLRLCLSIVALAPILALVAVPAALAQNRVKTETIRPASPSAKSDGTPDIVRDQSRLPASVAQIRERILAAARSGELQKLVDVMKTQASMPIFSPSDDSDPIAFWKANYPDSEGVEALSILITVLEMPFVHVDVGTPQEIYLWPYFARLPLKSLTPEQRVELFRIVTGADYKEMIEFGAYSFYRLGIAPDGSWQFFVSGD
jgi:hypothetical protein